MGNEFNIEKLDLPHYFAEDLIYNAIQLNEHLAKELSEVQKNKKTRLTSRLINLASATATISQLAIMTSPDTDTVIKNTMSH